MSLEKFDSMKNPTPGKNPFDLSSYTDRMPSRVRDLYLDMTENFNDFKGKSSRSRFLIFWLFTCAYLALLLWMCDFATHTALVFLGLLFCGWLYIAVPSFAISVRRLRALGHSLVFAIFPELLILYGVIEFALGTSPNYVFWAVLAFPAILSFALMSKKEKSAGEEKGL